MVAKTRSGKQTRVGRPKADPMSCASKSYKSKHPKSNLKSCSTSQTCKRVPGQKGSRCVTKKTTGRPKGAKAKLPKMTAKKAFQNVNKSILQSVKDKGFKYTKKEENKYIKTGKL